MTLIELVCSIVLLTVLFTLSTVASHFIFVETGFPIWLTCPVLVMLLVILLPRAFPSGEPEQTNARKISTEYWVFSLVVSAIATAPAVYSQHLADLREESIWRSAWQMALVVSFGSLSGVSILGGIAGAVIRKFGGDRNQSGESDSPRDE